MAVNTQIGLSWIFAGLVVAAHIKRKAKPEIAILRQQVGAGPDLVAVGGIRCRADVDRARACGASGVQVHRLFTAQGAQCLQGLIQPTCSDGDADS